MPCDALIIRLEKLLGDKELLRRVEAKGIHDFLGFDGRVITSSVMPDELLGSLTSERYVELLKRDRARRGDGPGLLHLH